LEHWNAVLGLRRVLFWLLFFSPCTQFRYNSEFCHIRKCSDDTAVVACVRGGQEREYRDLVESFNGWKEGR